MSLEQYERMPFRLIEDSPRRMRIVDKNGKVVMFSDYRQYIKMDEDEYNELYSLLDMMVKEGNAKGKKFLESVKTPVTVHYGDGTTKTY